MTADETILITTPNLAAPGMEILEARDSRLVFLPLSTSAEELTKMCARETPDGMISRSVTISAAAMDAAPNLRVISKYGVGYDNIDVEAAEARGIPVLITHGANSQSVAELTVGLMIALARRIPALDREVRGGLWIRTIDRGFELSGRRLGIIGHGEIGARVARIAAALGMEVAVYDPYITGESLASGAQRMVTIEELLRQADVVSLHCPLTQETQAMLDAHRLALMKPGALLINTARGEVVDDMAVVDAVKCGHLGGFAADAFSPEPPGADHPFLTLENAIMTPHAGAATKAAADRVAVAVVRNLILGLEGRGWDSRDVVNRPEQLAARSAL